MFIFKQTIIILIFITLFANLIFLFADFNSFLFIAKNYAIVYIKILLSIYLHELGHLFKIFIMKEKSDIISSGLSISVLVSKNMKDDFVSLFLGPFIPVSIGFILLIVNNNRNGGHLGISLYFISFIYLINFVNFFPFTNDGRNIAKHLLKLFRRGYNNDSN